MFVELTDAILPLLREFGPLGVLAGSLIEEVVAPIPSAAVILFGGFLLIPQDATFWEAALQVTYKVMLPASVGMAVGSLFPYYIARIGEKVAVDKFGRLLQVDWAMVEKAQKYFEEKKSDELVLFIVRAVPLVPSVVIAVFCGLIRMNVWTFLLFSFLGSIIRTFILGMVGWGVGAAYVTYADSIKHVEDIGLIVVAVAAVAAAFFFWMRLRRKKAAARAAAKTL